MGATPILQLPYPELPDTPDVPRDVKALADRIELVGRVGRGTALPAAPYDGQVFEWVYDDAAGAAWLMRYNAAAAVNRWEFIGGVPKYDRSDAAQAASTLPAYASSGPVITIPKSGLWRLQFGGLLFASSGPGSIGSMFLALLVAGAVTGRQAQNQAFAGTAAEAVSEYQGQIAKGTSVQLGTGQQSGTTGQSLNRWLTYSPIRIAND